MKLLTATRSGGKQREFRRVLEPAGIEVVFPDDVGLPPTPAEDMLELGETFEANARRKAEHFARLSGLPTVADDSGLEVLSLGGAPGVRSRRWAGASGSDAQVDAANNAELIRRLAGATGVRRSARYRCVLVYLRTGGAAPRVFEGACAGRILEEPRGEGGFGYDPYFFSEELGRTFAEAAPEEKDAVSHRGKALRELVSALKEVETSQAVTATIRAGAPGDFPGVIRLLESAGLPTAGLEPSLPNFLVAEEDGSVVGAIGLEVYGESGLLRSAVVEAGRRGSGLGRNLVASLLDLADARGVRDVYLLTTTAEGFFPRFGFARIPRDAVALAVRASEEFRGACPDSAIIMRRVTRSR